MSLESVEASAGLNQCYLLILGLDTAVWPHQ